MFEYPAQPLPPPRIPVGLPWQNRFWWERGPERWSASGFVERSRPVSERRKARALQSGAPDRAIADAPWSQPTDCCRPKRRSYPRARHRRPPDPPTRRRSAFPTRLSADFSVHHLFALSEEATKRRGRSSRQRSGAWRKRKSPKPGPCTRAIARQDSRAIHPPPASRRRGKDERMPSVFFYFSLFP